jgi:small subunit ribosomal protein S18
MMIKNAAVPASQVSSETKKIRKASNSLSTLAPVIRPPQGETIKTAEIAPRMVRSLGSVQSMKVLEKKSTKTGKNSSVIIKKAGPGTRTGPSVTSGSGPELDQNPKGVTSLRGPSSGNSPVGGKLSSLDSTGKPGAAGGVPKKGSRDLRSLIAVTNPERSLISAQNLPFLRRFVTEQGKILSRRLTRVTARQQREITKAIKQARILGYLQFVNTK